MPNLMIHALDMGDIQLDSSFVNWGQTVEQKSGLQQRHG